MTLEEEKSVIGGVVTEYSDVKKRLAALEAEGHNISKLFGEIDVAFRQPMSLPHNATIEKNLLRMPESTKLLGIVGEIKDKTIRKAELEKTIKAYGLDI